MTNPDHSRERKAKPHQPIVGPGRNPNGQPLFTELFAELSAAALAMSEMPRFGLRYWLFWHTSAVRLLGTQLDMLATGADGMTATQAAKPNRAR
jgi:hypothetical protein